MIYISGNIRFSQGAFEEHRIGKAQNRSRVLRFHPLREVRAIFEQNTGLGPEIWDWWSRRPGRCPTLLGAISLINNRYSCTSNLSNHFETFRAQLRDYISKTYSFSLYWILKKVGQVGRKSKNRGKLRGTEIFKVGHKVGHGLDAPDILNGAQTHSTA